MSTSISHPSKGKELRTLVKEDGTLHLSIEKFDIPTPKAHEVIVKVEATAINPSDVAVVIGFPALGNADIFGTNAAPKTPVKIPVPFLPAWK